MEHRAAMRTGLAVVLACTMWLLAGGAAAAAESSGQGAANKYTHRQGVGGKGGDVVESTNVLAEGNVGVGVNTRHARVLRRKGFAWPVREEVPAVPEGVVVQGAAAAPGGEAAAARTIVADHLVVTLRPGYKARHLNSVLKAFDGQVRRVLPVSGRVLVSFDGTDLEQLDRARELLAKSAAVASVTDDEVVQVQATRPNDPYFPQCWGLDNQGQESGTGTVAVIGGATYAAIPMIYSGMTGSAGLSAQTVDCGLGLTNDFTGDMAGKIAFVRRGDNTFAEKTANAMAAGAVGVIVANNVASNFVGTLGEPGAWPPVVGISQADGDALLAALPVGVTITIQGSKVDADIDAPEAWDRTTGNGSVIAAVIDTGIDYTHPDLTANIWTNPDEIPGNGLDDDGNGLVDDVHGYDFVNDDGEPMDGHGHGSHCAGTIGGVGNNGVGVAGVCWNVKLMALKGLSDGGSGTLSGLTECIAYATMMRQRGHNVRLTSNSWGPPGGGGADAGVEAAIREADAAGVLFVCAAGNDGKDHETTPYYPADYAISNIIVVAATDCNDALASFSCYGAVHVDLAAPGVGIMSTYKGAYTKLNGTSMATPHVAGAVALTMMANPSLDHLAVRAKILEGVDQPAFLVGKVATGGRLNVANTLALVGSSDDPWLSIAQVRLIVANDDGDREPDPGEGLLLSVALENRGVGDVTGVRVAVTVEDPAVTQWVETVVGEVAVGTVAEGAATTVEGLHVRVLTNAPNLFLPLTLRAWSDQGVWERVRGVTVMRHVSVVGRVLLDGLPTGGGAVHVTGPRQFVTTSDTNGFYRFAAESNSVWTLQAKSDGWLATEPVEVTVGSEAAPGPDLAFVTAPISGRVVSYVGEAIDGAEVRWSAPREFDGVLPGGTVTAAVDGTYSVPLVCGRPVTVGLIAFKTGSYATSRAEREVPPAAVCDFTLSSETISIDTAALSISAEVGEKVTVELSVSNPGPGQSRWSAAVNGALAASGRPGGQQVSQLPGLRPQPLIGRGRGLAYDNDAGVLYAGSSRVKADRTGHIENQIHVVDQVTGERLRTIPVQQHLRGGDVNMATLLDLAWSGSDLWIFYDDYSMGVAALSTKRMMCMDPVSERVIDEIAIEGDGSSDFPGWWQGLTWGDGYLWMVVQDDLNWPYDGVLYKIDPRTGAIITRTPMESPLLDYLQCSWMSAGWDGEAVCIGYQFNIECKSIVPHAPMLRYNPVSGKRMANYAQVRNSTMGLAFDDRGRSWQVGLRTRVDLSDSATRITMRDVAAGIMQIDDPPDGVSSFSSTSVFGNQNFGLHRQCYWNGEIVSAETGKRPWATLDQHGGELPATATATLKLTCDAALTTAGVHNARLVVCSRTRRIEVPITFTVTEPVGNRVPTAQPDRAETKPGVAVSIPVLANDTDPDNDALTVVAVTQGRGGRVSVEGQQVRYAPNPGFWGRDTFEYTVSDGHDRHLDRAEVEVLVDDAVEIPIPNATFEAQVLADGKDSTTITGWQPCNTAWDRSDWILNFWPRYLRCKNPGDLQYPGAADVNPAPGPLPSGHNVFAVRTGGARAMLDAVVESGATYTLSVSASTPIDRNIQIELGQYLYLMAGSAESETCLGKGSGLSTVQGVWNRYAVECNLPVEEELVGMPLSVRFWSPDGGHLWWQTPSEFETDFDDFRLLKRFLPADWGPNACPDQAVTRRDTPIRIDVLANDSEPEGQVLTLSEVYGAESGSVGIEQGQAAYTPAQGWVGMDTFNYVVADSSGKQAIGQCRVQVQDDGNMILVTAASLIVAEGGVNSFQIKLAAPPSGTVTVTVARVTGDADITIAAGANRIFTTADWQTYQTVTLAAAEDDDKESGSATIACAAPGFPTVFLAAIEGENDVNERPVADSQSVSTPEDTPVAITLTGSDPEDSALAYSILTYPSHGKLCSIWGQLTYVPATNYNGPDSFTFRVSDGDLVSASATVSINVTAVNYPPTAHDMSRATQPNVALPVTLRGSDPDNDPLDYTVLTDPANGTLSGMAPDLIYTPAGGFKGLDSFTFEVDDGDLHSGTATVHIAVADFLPRLQYEYYHGTWDRLPDFEALTPVTEGLVDTFDISVRTRNDNFAFRFTGSILVSTGGVYTFYTTSDDGSRLYVDGALVVDNDGLHGMQERSGKVTLDAGYHGIVATMFEKGGGEGLEVRWEGPGIAKQLIPADVLFHMPDAAADTDGDGIPDDADPDDDNDGMSDEDEVYAGTSPTNHLSVLRLRSCEVDGSGSQVVLRWPSVADRLYSVQAGSNLTDGFTVNLRTNIPATPPENVYTDSVEGVGCRFYRVRVE